MININFPIANISIKKWDKNEDPLTYILDDSYLYKASKNFYLEYFYNKEYVDSKGDIYKCIDRKLPNILRQFFSFLPNICKVELVFKITGEKMTIEEVRAHMLLQLNQLEKNDIIIEWIKIVTSANTYEQVIMG